MDVVIASRSTGILVFVWLCRKWLAVPRVPCLSELSLCSILFSVMSPFESVLLRLLTCIGDVYYLLLVPVLCLYLAIFVSNKLHSHQQQRQQQLPRQQITHRRPLVESEDGTPVVAAISTLITAPSSSLPFAVDTNSSVSESPASVLSSSVASASSSSPTPSSSSSPSSHVSLTFLLPDQSLVSHSFPVTASISTVVSTLYPPPSSLNPSARLIYQGRLLHSPSQLCHYNMASDDMVHVHLLHASRAAEAGVGMAAGAAGGASEPPAALVGLLAVMCAALGCGWGVFVVCGDVLFDVPSLCVLLCATGLTAVGVMYAHVGAASQRPAVVPM